MAVVFPEQPIQVADVLARPNNSQPIIPHLLIPELLAQPGRPWPTHASQRAGLLEKAQLQRISRLQLSTERRLRRHCRKGAGSRIEPVRLLGPAAAISTSRQRPIASACP